MIRLSFILVLLVLFFGCQNEKKLDSVGDYNLIRDGLYTDQNGNVYFKTVDQSQQDSPQDRYLYIVYSPEFPYSESLGEAGIREMKYVIDTVTFQEIGNDLFRDKNHTYRHQAMADGGTFSIIDTARKPQSKAVKEDQKRTKSGYDFKEVTDLFHYIESDYNNEKAHASMPQLVALEQQHTFSKIDSVLSPQLDCRHQQYFKSQNLLVLSNAQGTIFSTDSNDQVFHVFDLTDSTIRIILWNEPEAEHQRLYDKLRVYNALDTTNCGSSYSTSLDYILAEEIVYSSDWIAKNPIKFFDYNLIKVTNLKEDEDLLPDRGCIADDKLKSAPISSLCFPTSLVYNNWTCLVFDHVNNQFAQYYQQVFAD